jgi:predicted RND superfamily exporter protein
MADVRLRRSGGERQRALFFLSLAVFALPLMLYSVSGLDLRNDVAGWLPTDDEQSRMLKWHEELFPDEDRVLVSWDGCSVTDPRVDAFAARLAGSYLTGEREGGSELVASVTRPADLLRRMREQEIPLSMALERTSGLLTGDGPLCLSLNEACRPFTQSVADAAVELGRREFGITVRRVESVLAAPSSDWLSKDDGDAWGLFDDLREYAEGQRVPDLQLAWEGMHSESERNGTFLERLKSLRVAGLGDSPAVEEMWRVRGSAAGVSVLLSEAGSLDHGGALAAIERAASEAGISSESLRLGGRSVAAAELNGAVVSAAWNSGEPVWRFWMRSPILTSVLAGWVCCWLMLRSWRLCLMVQATALLTALGTTALVAPFGGSMNMVLAVMPTLLFVITLSGAVHLCNYWRQSLSGTVSEAISESIRQAWLPCVLSAATTAVGLGSLMTGTLVPVREFGLYSAIGCLCSLGAVLHVLPAMMRLWPAALEPAEKGRSSTLWPRFAAGVVNWSGTGFVLTLAVVLAACWGLRDFRTETRAICSFPRDSNLVQDYRYLEDEIAGIVPVDAIVRFSATQQERVSFEDRAQAVLRLQERLKAHPSISGALSLASFICASGSDSAEGAAVQRGTGGSIKAGGRLRGNLVEERIRDAVDGGEGRSTAISSLLALPRETVSLYENGRRVLHRAGDEIWRIGCQACILSADDYESLTQELTAITETELASLEGGAPECLVTGLVPIFLRTQQALLESLIRSFGVAFLLIGGVMVVQLRSVAGGLLAMLPNVLPVLFVFGLVSAFGIRVDVGTMITASVAMGIAVDGTLHMLSGFQDQLRRGLTRREAAERALLCCGPALVQSSAIIALGLLALYPVELLLISRFGWIMAALVGAALWCDAVLLTGLLAGPLGFVLEAAEGARAKTTGSEASEGASESGESQLFEIAEFPKAESGAYGEPLRGPHLPLWRGLSESESAPMEEKLRGLARSPRV